MTDVERVLANWGNDPIGGRQLWRNMKTDPPPSELRDIIGWSRYDGICTYHLTVGAGWIADDPNRYDAELWMHLPPHPAPHQWPPEPPSE